MWEGNGEMMDKWNESNKTESLVSSLAAALHQEPFVSAM